MAIAPQEAKKITNAEKQKVDSLEKATDEYLREHYTGSNSITVPLTEELSYRAQEELCRRYRAAGWEGADYQSKTHNGTQTPSLSLQEKIVHSGWNNDR